MSTTAEKIAVMQAFERGEAIEFRNVGSAPGVAWLSSTKPVHVSWNWVYVEYRIKPKPREWWVNVYPEATSGSRDGAALTKECADLFAGDERIECVHVREVIE